MFNLKFRLLFSISLLLLTFSATAHAEDPYLKEVLEAVKATSCSEVHVVIAKKVGVIQWAGGSLRYLYDEDIGQLKAAVLDSNKRVIETDMDLEIPLYSDPNFDALYDKFLSEVRELFQKDFDSHPPNGC
ncbi:MAG: hypothetical protein ACXVAX_05850 [Pseudobdellovibrio sp.]